MSRFLLSYCRILGQSVHVHVRVDVDISRLQCGSYGTIQHLLFSIVFFMSASTYGVRGMYGSDST